jgi:signal peptidase I
MQPAILPGERIIVWKPWMGARIFDVFASLAGNQPEIHRMPGFRTPRHNDVLVFNNPYFNGWNKIEMHIRRYYVKRCIALPGDTLRIENGYYRIPGFDGLIGNLSGQKKVSDEPETSLKERHVWAAYPRDSLLNWNIKNFGPLLILAKGTEIGMNRTNYLLYRTLIEWESGNILRLDTLDGNYYLNDSLLLTYCSRRNYYFMGGDQVEDSQDSRYWGLVPEEYIAGKAWFVWKSVDLDTNKFRWKRILKKIE